MTNDCQIVDDTISTAATECTDLMDWIINVDPVTYSPRALWMSQADSHPEPMWQEAVAREFASIPPTLPYDNGRESIFNLIPADPDPILSSTWNEAVRDAVGVSPYPPAPPPRRNRPLRHRSVPAIPVAEDSSKEIRTMKEKFVKLIDELPPNTLGIAKFFRDKKIYGRKGSLTHCPIGKYLKTQVPDGKYEVEVYSNRVRIEFKDPKSEWQFYVPQRVADFLRRFDNGSYAYIRLDDSLT